MVWRWLVNAFAVGVATFLVSGITVQSGSLASMALTMALVALVFGAVNTLVKPITELFTSCLIVATFGLFLLVVNALMLMLTSWLAGLVGLGWHVDGFWPALWGSIIISLVGMLLGGGFRSRPAGSGVA